MVLLGRRRIPTFVVIMKKMMFIMTHVGSGWEKLAAALEKAPQIQVFNTGDSYHHPDDLRRLTSRRHKLHNSSAIWVDLIFHNKDFTLKRLAGHYRFLYWSSTWESASVDLLKNYGDEQARAYYQFRIEGMKQYAKRQMVAWNPDLQSDTFLSSILR